MLPRLLLLVLGYILGCGVAAVWGALLTDSSRAFSQKLSPLRNPLEGRFFSKYRKFRIWGNLANGSVLQLAKFSFCLGKN